METIILHLSKGPTLKAVGDYVEAIANVQRIDDKQITVARDDERLYCFLTPTIIDEIEDEELVLPRQLFGDDGFETMVIDYHYQFVGLLYDLLRTVASHTRTAIDNNAEHVISGEQFVAMAIEDAVSFLTPWPS